MLGEGGGTQSNFGFISIILTRFFSYKILTSTSSGRSEIENPRTMDYIEVTSQKRICQYVSIP